MCDWQHSIEYFPHLSWMWEIFCGMLSCPHNNVMDLNIVMQNLQNKVKKHNCNRCYLRHVKIENLLQRHDSLHMIIIIYVKRNEKQTSTGLFYYWSSESIKNHIQGEFEVGPMQSLKRASHSHRLGLGYQTEAYCLPPVNIPLPIKVDLTRSTAKMLQPRQTNQTPTKIAKLQSIATRLVRLWRLSPSDPSIIHLSVKVKPHETHAFSLKPRV